jgi:hypothetical protein
VKTAKPLWYEAGENITSRKRKHELITEQGKDKI